MDADRWMVGAGSYRPAFPTERERFLLRVTLDQAAVSVETVALFRQAEQASVAKSRFIATMSHEQRTPSKIVSTPLPVSRRKGKERARVRSGKGSRWRTFVVQPHDVRGLDERLLGQPEHGRRPCQ